MIICKLFLVSRFSFSTFHNQESVIWYELELWGIWGFFKHTNLDKGFPLKSAISKARQNLMFSGTSEISEREGERKAQSARYTEGVSQQTEHFVRFLNNGYQMAWRNGGWVVCMCVSYMGSEPHIRDLVRVASFAELQNITLHSLNTDQHVQHSHNQSWD